MSVLVSFDSDSIDVREGDRDGDRSGMSPVSSDSDVDRLVNTLIESIEPRRFRGI